jgi:hypothetical protein
MSSQNNIKITGSASIIRVRLLVLSGYYIITTANTALFIPNSIAIIPFPFTVIFNNIYTGILS